MGFSPTGKRRLITAHAQKQTLGLEQRYREWEIKRIIGNGADLGQPDGGYRVASYN